MKLDRARMAVYALAGVYLLYLAYEMFGRLGTADEGRALLTAFTVFFGIVGAALVGLGVWSMYQENKARSEALRKEAQDGAHTEEDNKPEQED